MSLWVFGYGSLLWNPGFEVAESRQARLDGWHRSFCMRSVHHRGTDARPGLVLALDEMQGASCDGVAFKVAPGREDSTLAYLRERELISSAYIERMLPVMLPDAEVIDALCYVIDPHHVQYCGGLPLGEQARIIAAATGGRGPNSEYLWNTNRHLNEMGIKDTELTWLSERVKQMTS